MDNEPNERVLETVLEDKTQRHREERDNSIQPALKEYAKRNIKADWFAYHSRQRDVF